ncbi:hypothetical protein HaLaN_26679 [Haematococcus lacustris]|uniref:Uncharacterized protein n=1 Tax=Haematococcus lacustris TaxID=44745 RepID=A0A6A0A784_HAELA|nr:hypothetical protein HaLaN_26679 [Haematococcus lacustris]
MIAVSTVAPTSYGSLRSRFAAPSYLQCRSGQSCPFTPARSRQQQQGCSCRSKAGLPPHVHTRRSIMSEGNQGTEQAKASNAASKIAAGKDSHHKCALIF